MYVLLLARIGIDAMIKSGEHCWSFRDSFLDAIKLLNNYLLMQ